VNGLAIQRIVSIKDLIRRADAKNGRQSLRGGASVGSPVGEPCSMIQVQSVEVRDPDGFESAFDAAAKERIGAVSS
jgi:hypothetical protein